MLYPGFPWKNLQLTDLCLLVWEEAGQSQVLLGKDEDSDLGDNNKKERKKTLHASKVAN